MFRNFQTALPRNTTPATTHTVFIAPTTMPCSLTCSVLADDSRSSAIFRSSLPTKMQALLRVGDSSVGIKNAEAIQKLAPWKKLIFFQHSDEFFCSMFNMTPLLFKMVYRALVPNTRLYCIWLARFLIDGSGPTVIGWLFDDCQVFYFTVAWTQKETPF